MLLSPSEQFWPYFAPVVYTIRRMSNLYLTHLPATACCPCIMFLQRYNHCNLVFPYNAMHATQILVYNFNTSFANKYLGKKICKQET